MRNSVRAYDAIEHMLNFVLVYRSECAARSKLGRRIFSNSWSQTWFHDRLLEDNSLHMCGIAALCMVKYKLHNEISVSAHIGLTVQS
jgi:hypothetical protein